MLLVKLRSKPVVLSKKVNKPQEMPLEKLKAPQVKGKRRQVVPQDKPKALLAVLSRRVNRLLEMPLAKLKARQATLQARRKALLPRPKTRPVVLPQV